MTASKAGVVGAVAGDHRKRSSKSPETGAFQWAVVWARAAPGGAGGGARRSLRWDRLRGAGCMGPFVWTTAVERIRGRRVGGKGSGVNPEGAWAEGGQVAPGLTDRRSV